MTVATPQGVEQNPAYAPACGLLSEKLAMKAIDEIVTAASKLDPAQFLRLRRRLDRLEQKLWKAELARTSAELKKMHITDDEIDRLVVRRRHEGRS